MNLDDATKLKDEAIAEVNFWESEKSRLETIRDNKQAASDQAENTAKINEDQCAADTLAMEEAQELRKQAEDADQAQGLAVETAEADLAAAEKLTADTFLRCTENQKTVSEKDKIYKDNRKQYEQVDLCALDEAQAREKLKADELENQKVNRRPDFVENVEYWEEEQLWAQEEVDYYTEQYERAQQKTVKAQADVDAATKELAKWECVLEDDMAKCQSSWFCIIPDGFKKAGQKISTDTIVTESNTGGCVDDTLKFHACGVDCDGDNEADPPKCVKGTIHPMPSCVPTYQASVPGEFIWDNDVMQDCLSSVPAGLELGFTRGGHDLLPHCLWPWGDEGNECIDNYLSIGTGSESPEVKFTLTEKGKSDAIGPAVIVANAYGVAQQNQHFEDGLMTLDVTRHIEVPGKGNWQKATIEVKSAAFFCNFRYKFKPLDTSAQ
jgi:chemotaxis protein histidine kinase CheA